MRLLPIKSAYNFRDLGGYAGTDGRRIKWRKLIRSGDFAELSEADLSYLSGIPLLSVVDFRSEKETELIRNCMPSSVRNIYNFPVDAGNLVPKFKELTENPAICPEEIRSEATKLMETLYRELVTTYNSAYKSFFQLLQNDETPLLFHCSAGKDRTGVAAALVLSALGVERSVIYEDYLLTNSALKGKYDYLDEEYGLVTPLFKSVKKEFLESSFNGIEEQYGSVENYLTQELDVDINCLKELYLEKNRHS